MSLALVSVEEYLRTYQPACEYLDGILRQKPLPAWKHGFTQGRVGELVNKRFPDFAAAGEVTVCISETRFLVLDVIVQRKSELQEPYPVKPVHLAIETLSPEDRVSEMIVKCEEYHAWGVPFCWILDPQGQTAWDYPAGHRPWQVRGDGHLIAEPIAIELNEVFAASTQV